MCTKEGAVLLQEKRKSVVNEDDDFLDVDAVDDDDASQVGDRAGWSLSAVEVAAKQIVAERHYEVKPDPTAVTPAPTNPPVMFAPIPKVRTLMRLDVTGGSVTADQTVTLDSLVP